MDAQRSVQLPFPAKIGQPTIGGVRPRPPLCEFVRGAADRALFKGSACQGSPLGRTNRDVRGKVRALTVCRGVLASEACFDFREYFRNRRASAGAISKPRNTERAVQTARILTMATINTISRSALSLDRRQVASSRRRDARATQHGAVRFGSLSALPFDRNIFAEHACPSVAPPNHCCVMQRPAKTTRPGLSTGPTALGAFGAMPHMIRPKSGSTTPRTADSIRPRSMPMSRSARSSSSFKCLDGLAAREMVDDVVYPFAEQAEKAAHRAWHASQVGLRFWISSSSHFSLLSGGQASAAGANACESACTLMDRLSCTPLSAISGLMVPK